MLSGEVLTKRSLSEEHRLKERWRSREKQQLDAGCGERRVRMGHGKGVVTEALLEK